MNKLAEQLPLRDDCRHGHTSDSAEQHPIDYVRCNQAFTQAEQDTVDTRASCNVASPQHRRAKFRRSPEPALVFCVSAVATISLMSHWSDEKLTRKRMNVSEAIAFAFEMEA